MNEIITNTIRQIDNRSSITVFIVCALSLLSIIKYYFGKNIFYEIQSIFYFRQTLKMIDERRETDRQADMISAVLFMLITGIFITEVLPFYGFSPLWLNNSLSILFFTIITGVVYLVKTFIWKLLGILFLAQSFSKIYIYNMFMFNRVTGIIVVPFATIIPYIESSAIPYIIIIVIIIYVISFILKLWRIFQIFHTQNASIFYFILYLCTLEILPLLLFIKVCKILSENVFMYF